MFGFGKKKQTEQPKVEERSSCADYLTYNCASSYTTEKAMLLSTVYRCVEVISDSIA